MKTRLTRLQMKMPLGVILSGYWLFVAKMWRVPYATEFCRNLGAIPCIFLNFTMQQSSGNLKSLREMDSAKPNASSDALEIIDTVDGKVSEGDRKCRRSIVGDDGKEEAKSLTGTLGSRIAKMTILTTGAGPGHGP